MSAPLAPSNTCLDYLINNASISLLLPFLSWLLGVRSLIIVALNLQVSVGKENFKIEILINLSTRNEVVEKDNKLILNFHYNKNKK